MKTWQGKSEMILPLFNSFLHSESEIHLFKQNLNDTDPFNPGEEAPLAARDACFAVSRNGSIVIDFATLIRNAQGKALKLSLGRPKHGTLIRNPDGSYTYRPEAGYIGTDRFPYTVSNGQESASATIELRITAEEGERPGSSATICFQSEHARRTPPQPERLFILRGKPVGETPKIDWNGVAPVIACAPLWLPAFLTRKDEEELSPQRLAEITGLKFSMDRKDDDERK